MKRAPSLRRNYWNVLSAEMLISDLQFQAMVGSRILPQITGQERTENLCPLKSLHPDSSSPLVSAPVLPYFLFMFHPTHESKEPGEKPGLHQSSSSMEIKLPG